jgi:Mce-associated membrane protein
MTADDKAKGDDAKGDDVENMSDVELTDGGETVKANGVATDTTTHTSTQHAGNRFPHWQRGKIVPMVVALLLVVSGGLAAWLYLSQYRADQQTDAAAAQAAVDAARDGTVALLSYQPDTLDQDFAAAKSHLTGDFLNYYDQFTQQVVSPAAKEKAVTTSAQVVRAAASELHSNSAVVLVFVNQSTISKERQDPASTASSVLVSLAKIHGTWLITKFEPI